mgnify:CR=1 FL=1
MVIFYYVLIVIWWLKIFFGGQEVGLENYAFNFSYIFFNITGGVSGLLIAKQKWGGFSSSIGRGLSYLGLGLLGQGFGLTVWTIYNLVLKVEIPYPSLADIGYFALIPFYTIAMYNFAHASGAKFALRSLRGKLLAFVVPFVVLMLSYAFFIRDVGLDLNDWVRSFFDIAYPAGEAISVSLGLLTYLLSRNLLGGRMKKYIEFVIFALAFQYITEFTFLYTSGLGTYYNAGFVDLMYATSYFLMTVGLLRFRKID